VLITAYSHYAPAVLGLQLDKATAKLEAEGVPLAGIDVVNAPSPELVNQVIYQGMPDEAGKVTLKVYAPYYQVNEPQTSTAAPSTPPTTGFGGGAIAGSSGCLRPAAGTVIMTSVDTPCSVDLAATLGLPPAMSSDLRLETQPSHGSASWSNGTLTYTPAPGYRGPAASRCHRRLRLPSMARASPSAGRTRFGKSSFSSGRTGARRGLRARKA
jgi:hypothetical protein